MRNPEPILFEPNSRRYLPAYGYHRPRQRRSAQRSARMQPPCPHCDHPDMSLLRVVLIGEILRANETVLALLADLLQQSGLLDLSEKPKAPHARRQKGTLHRLKRSGTDRP